MSYYGISVIVTILITSVIAFYLLYKAKELNLDILISITSGSVVLGFSFKPTFECIMRFINDNVNFDKKVALFISLVAELLIFLLLVCILSFVISMIIPKKLSSIDCGIYIDKFLERTKNIALIAYKKMSIFPVKSINKFKENEKNANNLKNNIKKPVDTSQIIDTMDLEKNDNGATWQESTDQLSDFGEYIEPDIQEAAEEIAAIHTSDEIQPEEEIAAVEADEMYSFGVSSKITHTPVLTEGSETETEDLSEEPETELGTESCSLTADSEGISADLELQTEEKSVEDALHGTETDVQSFIDKAFEYKGKGKNVEAVEQYMKALEHNPDTDMIFWIVLDVCALYKQLGLSALARSILEGIVERYNTVIKPEIKEEIIRNLR